MTEPITLAEAKSHLRVTFEDDDSYITALITAARQYAENYQNRVYVDTTDSDGNAVTAETMPALEKAACLLLIGHWYETRTAVTDKAMAEVSIGARDLLNFRRNVPL